MKEVACPYCHQLFQPVPDQDGDTVTCPVCDSLILRTLVLDQEQQVSGIAKLAAIFSEIDGQHPELCDFS